MDTKSFAPYKFDATAWNRHIDEKRDVCQFLVLGNEAVSFMQDIFSDYPKYKADKNCTFRFVICDDVSAYYDYLDKRLVDNKVEYAPSEFVLDLNGMTDEAEKLKSRWKYYVILNGDKNRQKETLVLLLRLFDRHILHGDCIFNFDEGDLRWFLSSGVYLDAKVVKGSVAKESVRTDLIKAVRQDAVESMIIAFYQPMVKDRSCHWTQEMLTDICANIGKVVDECVCENLKCAFMEYGTEEPETIVLSMHHRVETTKKNHLAINQQILDEWKEEFVRRGNDPERFSYDGIMFRRGICREDGTDDSNLVSCRSDKYYTLENELWETAPLRILFLSKDRYIDDNVYGSNVMSFFDKSTTPEDYRLTSNRFLKRIAYAIYGLSRSTTAEVVPFGYPAEHEKEVLLESSRIPFAWINCNKDGGSSACSNSALVSAMNDYKDFLVRQIQNVDADIIVCCGYSENLSQSTGYPILDFLKENVYDFEYAGNEYQDIWFDKKSGKLAIGSWHPSARVSSVEFYNCIVNTYQRFIHGNPSFVESHRKGCDCFCRSNLSVVYCYAEKSKAQDGK